MESMKDYEKELERSFRTINEGDIVSGAVVAVTDEEVTLDLNYYAPGIIKIENLSNDPDFHAKEELQPGDIIEATVVRTDDGHGNIELSKKEANEVLAWDKLREMMEQQTVVTVRIKECAEWCGCILRRNPCIHSGIPVVRRLCGRHGCMDRKRCACRCDYRRS